MLLGCCVRVVKENDSKSFGVTRTGSNPVDSVLEKAEASRHEKGCGSMGSQRCLSASSLYRLLSKAPDASAQADIIGRRRAQRTAFEVAEEGRGNQLNGSQGSALHAPGLVRGVLLMLRVPGTVLE